MFVDFEYGNYSLSDFNCIVANVSTDGGLDTYSIGSNLTFSSVKNNNSSIRTKLSTSYEEVYSANFEIIKFDCNNGNDQYFDEYELRKITSWLNRKDYAKFTPIYSMNGEYESDTYYYGSFNFDVISINGKPIGLNLTFTSNAPYGFGQDETIQNTLTDSTDEMLIVSESDEIGYIYPKVTITCNASGNLIISNSLDDKKCVIKNCTNGEIITMDGEHKIITSSRKEHTTLPNDFSYNYIRIFKEYENDKGNDDSVNVITSTLPCDISITYSPIHKVGVIL